MRCHVTILHFTAGAAQKWEVCLKLWGDVFQSCQCVSLTWGVIRLGALVESQHLKPFRNLQPWAKAILATLVRVADAEHKPREAAGERLFQCCPPDPLGVCCCWGWPGGVVVYNFSWWVCAGTSLKRPFVGAVEQPFHPVPPSGSKAELFWPLFPDIAGQGWCPHKLVRQYLP